MTEIKQNWNGKKRLYIKSVSANISKKKKVCIIIWRFSSQIISTGLIYRWMSEWMIECLQNFKERFPHLNDFRLTVVIMRN